MSNNKLLSCSRNTTDCVDYVKLQHGAFGHTEFCGNDSSGNNYLLDTAQINNRPITN